MIQAYLCLIKMLSNENSSFQAISFVGQKAQSLLNREKNAHACLMFRPLSGNRQQLLIRLLSTVAVYMNGW